ncbi:MAG: hemoglobin-like flavoprotein, partial [bacterium]
NNNDNLAFPNIQTSLNRCLMKDGFIDRFYEIFLSSDPKIKPRFANTNFDAQMKLLRYGINLAVQFANRDELAANIISRLGTKHNVQNLNINPELYPFWTNSLIKALSEFDDEFTAQLENEWRTALQLAIDEMAKVY